MTLNDNLPPPYLSQHLELLRRDSRDSRLSDPRVTAPASLSRLQPLTSTMRSDETLDAAARPASVRLAQLPSSSVCNDPWVAKAPSVRPVTRLQPPRSSSSRWGRWASRATPASVRWLQAAKREESRNHGYTMSGRWRRRRRRRQDFDQLGQLSSNVGMPLESMKTCISSD